MTRQAAQNQKSRRFALVPLALVLAASFVLAGAALAEPTPRSHNTGPVIDAMTAQHFAHHPASPRPAALLWEGTSFAKDSAGYALSPSRPKVVAYLWHNVHSKGEKLPDQVYRPPRAFI